MCRGVGWTAARTDRQHRHRVDWMGLTDIDTQNGANVYQNMSDLKHLLGGVENHLTRNEYQEHLLGVKTAGA